jgi:SAM-dependent methyltransferase
LTGLTWRVPPRPIFGSHAGRHDRNPENHPSAITGKASPCGRPFRHPCLRFLERVAFQPADATALPFPDASFDAVICQFGVMFFPDKDRSYREVLRVLAPGGRYMFSVWDAHRYNPFGRIAHEVIGSFFPTDPPKFYEVPFSYYLIDPIKESLMAAGLDRIVVSVVRQHRSVADFSAFARGVVFGNPVFDQIRQRGGVKPAQIQEAVATAMRHEFGGEPGVMPIQAIVFEAQKPSLPDQVAAT